MIAIDLSKEKALDDDPKSIQQINFTQNLEQAGGATIFFIIDKAEGNFFTRNCEIIMNLFCFNIMLI